MPGISKALVALALSYGEPAVVAPPTRRAHSQPPPDQHGSSTYAQRLRAHSKRAWNMFNDLMAVGELDRHYGPVLAAHVYLTRGHASHTVSQRAVAEHAGLPYDRVKDQMQRLEALGMLSHAREGNRWRTTLLPFVSLANALSTLSGAREWSRSETSAYLSALVERGVRLPWAVSPVTAPDDAVPAPSDGARDTTLVQHLADAIAAFGRNDFQTVQVQLDHAVRALAHLTRGPDPARTCSDADDSIPVNPPSITQPSARASSPESDPEIPPTGTPTAIPRRSRKPAQQHADRWPLMGNQNQNRRSESHRVPPYNGRVPISHDGGRTAPKPPTHDPAVDANTRQLLVAEGMYPANIQRFATLPSAVIQAAIAAAELPVGHPHRPGRIVERLDAYTNGLWRPLHDVSDDDATSRAAQAGTRSRTLATLHHPANQEPDACATIEDAAQRAVWTALLEDLRGAIGAAEFETWLGSMQLVDILEDTIVIAAANVFARDQIALSYGRMIEQLLRDRVGRPLSVSLVIG